MSAYIRQRVRLATEDESAWFSAFGGVAPKNGEAWFVIDGTGHLLSLSSVYSTGESDP